MDTHIVIYTLVSYLERSGERWLHKTYNGVEKESQAG